MTLSFKARGSAKIAIKLSASTHASDARAAHVMRGEVGDYRRDLCGDQEGEYACAVIVGELLGNTVDHAPGHVHMIVEW